MLQNLTIKTKGGRGKLHYLASNQEGRVFAKVTLMDGKFKNYSIVPVIVSVEGSQKGLRFIFDYMFARSKGPLVIRIYNKDKVNCLKEYNLKPYGNQWVWDVFNDLETIKGVDDVG